jgi:hypothetical protein
LQFSENSFFDSLLNAKLSIRLVNLYKSSRQADEKGSAGGKNLKSGSYFRHSGGGLNPGLYFNLFILKQKTLPPGPRIGHSQKIVPGLEAFYHAPRVVSNVKPGPERSEGPPPGQASPG